MVRGRLVPTNYFRDPDVMSLSSGDVRLILVGLVLQADDYGRGLAHPAILGRDLDYPAATIEAALAELERAELLQCYQQGKHRYFVISRWEDWQKLTKRTPSHYPAPPMRETAASTEHPEIAQLSPENPGNAGFSQDFPGKSWESSPESESESESNENRIEDEGEARSPLNVVPFPAARADNAVDAAVLTEKKVREASKQVAAILRVPVSDGLQRVVVDYLGDHSVSLLGEADAAREWIDDPKRNRKQQQLTPAFFRRWLKRELETIHRGYAPPGAATPETSSRSMPQPTQTRAAADGVGPPAVQSVPSQAENPYQVFVRERAQAVLRRVQLQREEVSP
jgi:hypothetical protein